MGRAIRDSGLDRSEVYLTTKCFNDDQGYEQAKRALQASLERLQLEYVDLYLITGQYQHTTSMWIRGGPSSSCKRKA